MNINDFCKELEQEMLDTDNIKISITKSKGFITFFWSTTFLKYTNCEWFDKIHDEIVWANSKINQISEKYKHLHHAHLILTEQDVEHFDYLARIEKIIPIKRSWQTNTQSFGGWVQFRYPKDA